MIDLINGRTPEEIKRGLRWIFHDCDADGEDCNECECVEECHKLVEDDVARDALAYIERLEAAQPKWISVEERLPERECLAIGWQHEMLIGNVYRSGAGYACESDGEYLMDVTYWMPLPEKPKEARDGTE